MKHPLLSICINTKNRAGFLAETLDSIIKQMVAGVEIIVVDGASQDSTAALMERLSSEHPFIKYIRSEKDLGIDDGYDAAVGYASGDYCWLMTDDDLLFPQALEVVLSKINDRHDLVIVNLECFTKDLRLDLNQRLFNLKEDRLYRHNELSLFLAELGYGLAYIGCVVIRRSLWTENDRTGFFGTYFVHVGVICGSSLLQSVLYLHSPLIKYRSGNSSWTGRSFEIWYFKWPNLIWSFNNLSVEIKTKIVPREPWRRALTLLKSRAMGEYDYKIFKKYLSAEKSKWERLWLYAIARLPVTPLSFLLVLGCLLFRRTGLYTLYNLMVSSPRPRFSRKLIQAFGLNFPSSTN